MVENVFESLAAGSIAVGDGVQGGSGGTDGHVLIDFKIDRGWQFRQQSTGSGAALELHSLSNKAFRMSNSSDAICVHVVTASAQTDSQFVVGSGTPVASAGLQHISTTKGFLPPVMTTTQRDAITPATGLMLYNSSSGSMQVYTGATWEDMN